MITVSNNSDDMPDPPFTLNITGLSIDEIKEVAKKIREIEQRHPKRDFLIWISGTENMETKEALKILGEIFPKKLKVLRTYDDDHGHL